MQDLKDMLQTLQAYKREHPEVDSIRITLLAYSMGAIVLKDMMESYSAQDFDRMLIDNIILSSPAVDSGSHAAWISKIDFSKRVYVTVNNHDLVLGYWRNLQALQALGSTLVPPLARNAIYVNVSDLGVGHRYFIPRMQNQSLHLCEFYKSALNGEEVALTKGVNVSRIEDEKVFWIKREKDSNGHCIRSNARDDES